MSRQPVDHGTRACYQRGCRLPACTQANRDYCKLYRANGAFHGHYGYDVSDIIDDIALALGSR